MTRLFLILFIFSSSLYAQTIGESIGIVTLSNRYSPMNKYIDIYNVDGTLWKTVSCYHIGRKADKTIAKTRKDLKVIGYGFEFLQIRCLAKNDSLFTVVIDEAHPKIKYVSRYWNNLEFQTWEDYILDASTIGFKSELLDTINGEVINRDNLARSTFFLPVLVAGNWLQVKWNINARRNDLPIYKFGWLKWRDETEIIVYPLYLR